MHESNKPERLVRRKEAIARIGHGRTWFDEHIVRTGRLKFFRVGARSVACLNSALEILVAELAAGAPCTTQQPRTSRGRYRGAANDAA
jgi:predicted DNA-binding transcriptional regulator AlpA